MQKRPSIKTLREFAQSYFTEPLLDAAARNRIYKLYKDDSKTMMKRYRNRAENTCPKIVWANSKEIGGNWGQVPIGSRIILMNRTIPLNINELGMQVGVRGIREFIYLSPEYEGVKL